MPSCPLSVVEMAHGASNCQPVMIVRMAWLNEYARTACPDHLVDSDAKVATIYD